MEGTAQNKEQVHSPQQKDAEHLPKAPTELFLFFFSFNTSLTFFPAKKHLAAVLNFSQISHLCSFTGCNEKWITGTRIRANSSGSDYFKPYQTHQVSSLLALLTGISHMSFENLSSFFYLVPALKSCSHPLLL